MGSASDAADLERFMRSPEGQARLDGIRSELEGKSICAVSFSNDMLNIGIELQFVDGTSFAFTLPELDVDILRADYEEMLEREYFVDYPERRDA